MIFSGHMYFSYSSFFVYDDGLKTTPACLWTDAHGRQGFARRENHVQFGTLFEFGYADLAVYLSPYQARPEHRRVIEVPLEVASGRVIVLGGPDDLPGRRLTLAVAAHYALVAAQAVGVTRDDDRDRELTNPLRS
jgi:hypothetical protein